jgi:hypothetical protein
VRVRVSVPGTFIADSLANVSGLAALLDGDTVRPPHRHVPFWQRAHRSGVQDGVFDGADFERGAMLLLGHVPPSSLAAQLFPPALRTRPIHARPSPAHPPPIPTRW